VEPLTADALFERHFLGLYRADGHADASLDAVRARPSNPAANPGLVQPFEEAALAFARLAPLALARADLDLDFTDASVHRLGAALASTEGRALRDAWLAEATAKPGEASTLQTMVIHGVAYVAACIARNHGGKLALRSPLWETRVVLTSAAGTAELSVLSWWLRALADGDEARAGLAERYRTLVEVPTFDWRMLPRIAPPTRALPTLRRVTYDLLFKHLKAHLPELRDLGRDFPSPERFSELGLAWLGFTLLGEGRMVLLLGPSNSGAHALWLEAGGFSKAAFFPWAEGDLRDPATVKAEVKGDVLRLYVGRVTHEMLWWGP
jgi:hypothetical protein